MMRQLLIPDLFYGVISMDMDAFDLKQDPQDGIVDNQRRTFEWKGDLPGEPLRSTEEIDVPATPVLQERVCRGYGRCTGRGMGDSLLKNRLWGHA